MKFEGGVHALLLALSHPTGVRGLKSIFAQLGIARVLSHPTGVRGLKFTGPTIVLGDYGRTPLGCVD